MCSLVAVFISEFVVYILGLHACSRRARDKNLYIRVVSDNCTALFLVCVGFILCLLLGGMLFEQCASSVKFTVLDLAVVGYFQRSWVCWVVILRRVVKQTV